METKKAFSISLLNTGLVLVIRTTYYTHTKQNFKKAVQMFSFNLLNYDQSFFMLYVISMILPVVVMIMLFGNVYSNKMSNSQFVSKVVMRHLVFGYLTMSIIYVINVLNDYVFLSYYSTKNLENYNEWHKYVLHFILTPVFFLDSIYSIEIEKIKYENVDRNLTFNKSYYYLAQVFFGSYLVYALLVVLFLDNQLVELFYALFSIKSINKTSKISEYLVCLINDVIVCVFVSLAVGIVDQGITIIRFTTLFKIYSSGTSIKNEYVVK
ncbi:uncharacterized protein VICG_01345 [Vittaforma corneae ATCC 50505]|uniref:Uncharacterized protein n=1 Tax=Vittaforma corneae (strain ATCC 50505) TaxID=993615 RepID=L2GMS8_VITCO|nr:uncharacterized protein VICG_01345 [Vittaforma corneae ATCC 50505]ELA41597.1 hypothetical protein VICG_01345 [Vittaforma corneae ATCC 50505]